MPRSESSLSSLEVRKQLLVTEAELHREEMLRDFKIISASVGEIGRKARAVGKMASTVALLIGGITAWRGVRKHPHRNGQPSVMSRLFRGLKAASGMWRGLQTLTHTHHPRN